jgi:hypothetical protein
VLVDLIARTEVVHVPCERAVGNAALSANAVTTKAELSIEDLGFAEVTCIKRLLPVTE